MNEDSSPENQTVLPKTVGTKAASLGPRGEEWDSGDSGGVVRPSGV